MNPKSKHPTTTSKEEETKQPNLLKSLTQFQVSIIARFLTAKQKLLTMALLNKQWRQLVSQHFSWSRFPELKHNIKIQDFQGFLSGFSELTGVTVPYLRGEHLSQKSIKLLYGASRIIKLTLSTKKQLNLVKAHPLLLSKLQELSICFLQGSTTDNCKIVSDFNFLSSIAQIIKLNWHFYLSDDYGMGGLFDDDDDDIAEPLKISLMPLKMLKEFKFTFVESNEESQFDAQISDFPKNLEILTLPQRCDYTTIEIKSLKNLHTLQFDKHISSSALISCISENLRNLTVRSISQQVVTHLSNLRSLTLIKQFQSIIISDLPQLQELVVGGIQQDREIKLSKLPSLKVIIMKNHHRLVLHNGISDNPVTLKSSSIDLNSTKADLKVENKQTDVVTKP